MHLLAIGLGFYLETTAAMAYLHMRDDAAKIGITLTPNTAFRTMSYQVLLRKRWEAYDALAPEQKAQATPVAYAAKPGYSNHQSGIAIDINCPPDVQAWLSANALNYGFVFPVDGERWHAEYRPDLAKERLAKSLGAYLYSVSKETS